MSPSAAPAVQAAGALVWRALPDGPEVLLVHRPRYDDWSWPKGKVEPGETLPETATREVAEETGVEVVLGQPLPGLRYRTSDGRRKHAHYWAARPASPDEPALAARARVQAAPATEIDASAWLPAAAAAERLTRPEDREPLAALVRLWEHGRLATHPVVVARHGRARKRATWTGTEGDRPLTDVGAAQAGALVPVLAAFGVAHVVTSGWERCWATVQPYAAATRLPVHVEASLTETAHAHAPGRVARVVHALVEGSAAAVLCTHRPVLPTVVDVLAQHTRRAVADELPSSDPFLRPAEVLVAHVATTEHGPRVVAAERHRAG